MTATPFSIASEVLDAAALDLKQLAHACQQKPEWVVQHVRDEVLHVDSGENRSQWRFSSLALLRAKRIAYLETAFDADPQLAALAADLIEEVVSLRKKLRSSD